MVRNIYLAHQPIMPCSEIDICHVLNYQFSFLGRPSTRCCDQILFSSSLSWCKLAAGRWWRWPVSKFGGSGARSGLGWLGWAGLAGLGATWHEGSTSRCEHWHQHCGGLTTPHRTRLYLATFDRDARKKGLLHIWIQYFNPSSNYCCNEQPDLSAPCATQCLQAACSHRAVAIAPSRHVACAFCR